MSNILSQVIGEKKAWEAMKARAQALPPDHRAAYDQITRDMWKVAAADGKETLAALDSATTLFEQEANRQQTVRGVTGSDVAAVSDAPVREHAAASHVDEWRASLNAHLAGKHAE